MQVHSIGAEGGGGGRKRGGDFPLRRQTGFTLPSASLNFLAVKTFYFYFGLTMSSCDYSHRLKTVDDSQTQSPPENKTNVCQSLWVLRRGGRGGRCISLCVEQQGRYRTLTCLQRRGRSQICGGAAASGLLEARRGARAVEAVHRRETLTHTQHPNTTINHSTQGLLLRSEFSSDTTKLNTYKPSTSNGTWVTFCLNNH